MLIAQAFFGVPKEVVGINLAFLNANRLDDRTFTHEEEQRWADEARKLEEEQEYNG